MKLAFDSSLLVAGLVESHSFHHRAWPWLEAAGRCEVSAECSWHALAETWSVLTKLPLDPPLTPQVAELGLERLMERVDPRPVGPGAYRAAIRRCVSRGLRSGAVFDALHLVVAEESGVDALVTFNPRDFDRLSTEKSPRIVLPPDPPAVTIKVG